MRPLSPLPIDAVLPELVASLAAAPSVVLEAPPGAGKTTRVPWALFEQDPEAEVVVTEPRRIAARLAAERVAEERGERVGETVGYRVRFEEAASAATRIRYVTEGVLLRRLLTDPTLRGTRAVVLDEFHERHLETDVLLALLVRLQQTSRPDLRLVVMSATLDAEAVAEKLKCPRLASQGRLFPVSIEHLARPDDRPLEKQVVSAVRRLLDETPGDILVFLPGAFEIRRAAEALAELERSRDLSVVPLHGDLPVAEQARAIQPGPRRKVVLSTNVAESSVTIEGVTGVVDSGLARVAEHSPWTGLTTLVTRKVSRASAEQRAGRAGRLAPGHVVRLYTRGDFETRPEHDTPELSRSDLTEMRLLLHALTADPSTLCWLEPPPAAALDRADDLLRLLGATDGDGRLTAIGRRLLELPLHPRLARILHEGERRGVGRRAARLVALLAERDIRSEARTDFGDGRRKSTAPTGPSDLLELEEQLDIARELGRDRIRLLRNGFEPRAVESVLRAEAELRRATQHPPRGGDVTPEAEDEALLVSIFTGFVDRLARRRRPGAAELVLANGKTARLSDQSVVREAELLVALDVDERTIGPGSSAVTIRRASAVRGDWLMDLCSERLTLDEELVWNEDAERVELATRLAFGAITLEETRVPAPPSPEASAVLERAVLSHGVQEFLRADAIATFSERLALFARHYPNANAPVLDEAEIERFVRAACQNRTSFAELRAADPVAALRATLEPAVLAQLSRACPERITLPGGRSVVVHYEPGRPPWVESRLQDFFGMSETPRLLDGRLPLTVHLLAPNGRAVQVTQDLAGFWERHYPSIRRELMRRYPKHAWPEDGRRAEPPKAKSRS